MLAPTHNSDHWVITNLHKSKYDFLFLEVVLLQRKKNGWSPGKKTRRRMNRFKQAENLLCAMDDIWVNCSYEGHVIKVATRPHFTWVGNIILAQVSWCLMPSIIHQAPKYWWTKLKDYPGHNSQQLWWRRKLFIVKVKHWTCHCMYLNLWYKFSRHFSNLSVVAKWLASLDLEYVS